MIEPILGLYAFTLDQVAGCASTLDDDRMAEMPVAGSGGAVLKNHPAWTLEHLITSSGGILLLMGERPAWATRERFTKFGPGSTPVTDRAVYGRRNEMVARLRDVHTLAAETVRARHAEMFDRPPPEAFAAFGKTIGGIATYLLAAHESYHLGQLAQWKAAMAGS